jgi:hypothetical protein
MSAACSSPLLSALISLAGVALGGIVGYLSARKVSDRNALAAARARFRAAFAPALAMVTAVSIKRTSDVTEFNLSGYLKDNFVQHAAAIEEFRPFVQVERRASFQRAWEQYLELDPIYWTGMSEFMAEHLNPDNPLKVIRARIEALLHHSEA